MISKQSFGSLICLCGVLTLTTDTLLLRKVDDVEPQTVMFFRYGLFGFAVLIYFISKHGYDSLTQARNVGLVGGFGGMLLGASDYLFTTAIHLTAVANVLVIYATSSMFSALFSWLFAGEVLLLRTSITIAVCIGATLFIFYDQIGGDGSEDDITGNICAVFAAITMGSYLSLVSYAESKLSELGGIIILDTSVSSARGAAPASVISIADYMPMVYLLLQGLIVLPVSFTLLTIGPKYISAPEVSLFMLIETVLGPLFVWLGGYEAPPARTLYGGAIIVCALTCNSIYSMLQSSQRNCSSPSGRYENMESPVESPEVPHDISTDIEIATVRNCLILDHEL